MNAGLFFLLLVGLLLNPSSVFAHTEGMDAQTKSLMASYYEELGAVAFGKKVLNGEDTLGTEAMSDENINKYGYYLKSKDGHDTLYKNGSNVALPADEIPKLYRRIEEDYELKFYQDNLELYKRDYEELLEIRGRYKNVPHPTMLLPKITNDGSLDIEDFKMQFSSMMNGR